MARWTASAKWAEGPALDGQRDMPLGLSLSEGLGISALGVDVEPRTPGSDKPVFFEEALCDCIVAEVISVGETDRVQY
jgi:hypothetical protein